MKINLLYLFVENMNMKTYCTKLLVLKKDDTKTRKEEK